MLINKYDGKSGILYLKFESEFVLFVIVYPELNVSITKIVQLA